MSSALFGLEAPFKGRSGAIPHDAAKRGSSVHKSSKVSLRVALPLSYLPLSLVVGSIYRLFRVWRMSYMAPLLEGSVGLGLPSYQANQPRILSSSSYIGKKSSVGRTIRRPCSRLRPKSKTPLSFSIQKVGSSFPSFRFWVIERKCIHRRVNFLKTQSRNSI